MDKGTKVKLRVLSCILYLKLCFLLSISGLSSGGVRTLEFSVLEESAIGTVIGSLSKQFQNDGLYISSRTSDSGISRAVSFYVQYLNNNTEQLIDVSQSGLISVKGRLDRETQDSLQFVVESSETNDFILVSIKLIDINDNLPCFNKCRVTATISENTPPGTMLVSGIAEDADEGVNSVAKYEIVELEELGDFFEIVSHGNPVGFQLRLLKRLDYEKQFAYSFSIRAVDGYRSSSAAKQTQNLSSECIPSDQLFVNIQIQNENEKSPQFTTNNYETEIYHVAAIGSYVIQVKALNTDQGEDSTIRYSLPNSLNDENDLKLYRIDSVTGVLSVNGQLTNLIKCFKFTVSARDSRCPYREGFALISINVLQANRNVSRTELGVDFPTEISYFRISWLELNNDNLRKQLVSSGIDISDTVLTETLTSISKVNSNQHAWCQLLPLDDSEVFHWWYLARLSLHDLSSSNLNLKLDSCNLNLTSELSAITESSSNRKNGRQQRSRYDRNGKNGRNADNYRRVNQGLDSGVKSCFPFILVPAADKRETTLRLDYYLFLVELDCVSSVDEMLEGSATNERKEYRMGLDDASYDSHVCPPLPRHNVTVLVNSNNRIIDRHTLNLITYPCQHEGSEEWQRGPVKNFYVELKTTDPAGTKVICISEYFPLPLGGSKSCTGENPKISGNQDSVLRARRNTEYRDSGHIPQYGRKSNPQPFQNDESPDYNIYDYSFTFTYGLSPLSHLFQINPLSGLLSTADHFHCNQDFMEYNLSVIVKSKKSGRDSERKKSEDEIVIAKIRVLVKSDKSERNSWNIPRFDKLFHQVAIPETWSVGEAVTQVNATSRIGCGKTRRLVYSLHGNGPDALRYFAINNKTGVIYLNKNLTGASWNVLDLLVLASNSDGYSAQTIVQIRRISSSADLPLFDFSTNVPNLTFSTSPSLTLKVPEDVETGSPIYIAQALAPGIHSKPIYSFKSGRASEVLSLDRATGEIRLIERLDYEKSREWQAVVVAIEEEFDLTAEVLLRIDVVDVNDNEPKFVKNKYEFSARVKRNVPSGNRLVGQVTAVDADEKDTHRYSIQSVRSYNSQPLNNLSSFFSINPQNGLIYLNSSTIPFSLPATFILDTTATDIGLPPKSSTVETVVHLLDSEAERLKFSSDSWLFFVSEDAKKNSAIGRMKAACDDPMSIQNSRELVYSLLSGADGFDPMSIQNSRELVYSLLSGADGFEINATTGQISVKRELDRETKDIHDLKIQVSVQCFETMRYDETSPNRMKPVLQRRTSVTNVKIRVLDVNDNFPTFSKLEEFLSIDVTDWKGERMLLYRVLAKDLDLFENGSLEYRFSEGHSEEVKRIFCIDGNTGWISTSTSLHKNDITSLINTLHNISVKACDQGNPPKCSHQAITIQFYQREAVMNRNIRSLMLSVADNIQVGSVVGTVKLDTILKPMDSKCTAGYFLIDSDDFGTFDLNESEGSIILSKSLGIKKSFNMSVAILTALCQGNSSDRLCSHGCTISDLGNRQFVPSSKRKTNITKNTRVNNRQRDDTFGEEEFDNMCPVFKKSTDFKFAASYSTGRVSQPLCVVDIVNVTISVVQASRRSPSIVPTQRLPAVIKTIDENVASGSRVFSIDYEKKEKEEIRFSMGQMKPREMQWFKISEGWIIVASDIDYEKIKRIDFDVNVMKNEELIAVLTYVVLVSDINDNYPQINIITPSVQVIFKEPNIYRASVALSEGAELKTRIAVISATDADRKQNGNVLFKMAGGNLGGVFHLDSISGELTLSSSLDREFVSSYNLSIEVSDNGIPALTSYLYLLVLIEDINDNSPVFESLIYNASIKEGMEPGSSVIRVTAHDADKPNTQNSDLIYFIPAGVGQELFTIDQQGLITTLKKLDRETNDHWSLTVYVHNTAGSMSTYGFTTVSIKVLDVNDNSPAFHETSVSLVVPENVPMPGIHTATASDSDIGVNSQLRYGIQGDESVKKLFGIDSITGRLSCDALDREQIPEYNFIITAHDLGSPSLTGSSVIRVKVTDVNDNDPVFTQASYAVEVAEDVAVGTVVLNVSASDADEGPNGEISYTLVSATTSDEKCDLRSDELFSIDPNTGVITTNGELDRERCTRHRMEILVRDSGLYSPRSRSARLDVTILDVNDNAPVFDQFPYQAVVPVDLSVGKIIVTVSATDKDSGENGRVMYSVIGQSAYFTVDEESGEVITKRALDMYAVGQHNVNIRAEDRGQRPKNSTGVVSITVGSQKPSVTLRFINQTQNVFIDENSPSGTPVVTVKARPMDFKSSSYHIIYSFASGNDDNTFSINEETGLISVQDPARLDYEISPRLRLIVIATATSPSLSASAYDYTTVWINLRDVNDNVPRFTHARYTSAVWEDAQPGTYVTQVIALDPDSDLNGRVSYSIISGNVNDSFVIAPSFSGIVMTSAWLDRERKDSYKLEIEARDMGAPEGGGGWGQRPPRTITTLRIQIVDVNDNAPVINNIEPVIVREGIELGSLITQITATDADLDTVLSYQFIKNCSKNAKRMSEDDIRYKQNENAEDSEVRLTGRVCDEESFSIDSHTGKVYVEKPLDYERQTQYKLIVMVSDQVHNVTAVLIVNVKDENDNAPVFSQPSYSVDLAELTPEGTSVLTVVASDADSGVYGSVQYSMLETDGFSIYATTGVIYTTRKVVFNANQPSRHLVVQAYDMGDDVVGEGHKITGRSQTSVVNVHINVYDVNNHAPVFDHASYIAHVPEDASLGTGLSVRLTATDGDHFSSNTKLSFSFLPPIQADLPFLLETVSTGNGGYFGLVTVNGVLDREQKAYYNLTVCVTDQGESALNSTAGLLVVVTDVNDNSPVFKQDKYHVSVRENVTYNTEILRVEATDADEGSNGRVEYSLEAGSDAEDFMIDRTTGVISVRAAILDYEKKQKYVFRVLAMNSVESYGRSADQSRDQSRDGSRGRIVYAEVTVEVTDVNEFQPRFPNIYPYIVPVIERQAAGIEVQKIKAEDKDGGEYGTVRYSLSSMNPEDDGLFKINPETGVITTTAVLTFTQSSAVYKYNLVATDRGNLSDTILVSFLISPEPLRPHFERYDYRFDVRGDAQPGEKVGEVKAQLKSNKTTSIIMYFLAASSPYFEINSTTGILYVAADLRNNPKDNERVDRRTKEKNLNNLQDEDDVNNDMVRRKRSREDRQILDSGLDESESFESKRIIRHICSSDSNHKKLKNSESSEEKEMVTLNVVAQSGFAKQDCVQVGIVIDRSCEMCAVVVAPSYQKDSLTGARLVVLFAAVMSVVLIVIAAAFATYYRRINRENKQNIVSSEIQSLASGDTVRQIGIVGSSSPREDGKSVASSNHCSTTLTPPSVNIQPSNHSSRTSSCRSKHSVAKQSDISPSTDDTLRPGSGFSRKDQNSARCSRAHLNGSKSSGLCLSDKAADEEIQLINSSACAAGLTYGIFGHKELFGDLSASHIMVAAHKNESRSRELTPGGGGGATTRSSDSGMVGQWSGATTNTQSVNGRAVSDRGLEGVGSSTIGGDSNQSEWVRKIGRGHEAGSGRLGSDGNHGYGSAQTNLNDFEIRSPAHSRKSQAQSWRSHNTSGAGFDGHRNANSDRADKNRKTSYGFNPLAVPLLPMDSNVHAGTDLPLNSELTKDELESFLAKNGVGRLGGELEEDEVNEFDMMFDRDREGRARMSGIDHISSELNTAEGSMSDLRWVDDLRAGRLEAPAEFLLNDQMGSMESIHQFTDEGGGEVDGFDSIEVTYPPTGPEKVLQQKSAQQRKSREIQSSAPLVNNMQQKMSLANAGNFVHNLHSNSQTASDRSGQVKGPAQSNADCYDNTNRISNSSDDNERTDTNWLANINWNQVLNWAPAYEDLAPLYCELGRLKNVHPYAEIKTCPTRIVPQRHQAGMRPLARGPDPPPIIVDRPPSCGNRSGRESSETVLSNDTSLLGSVSVIKTPLSYESSYTPTTLSPINGSPTPPPETCSPALSALDYESPSDLPVEPQYNPSFISHNVNSQYPMYELNVVKNNHNPSMRTTVMNNDIKFVPKQNFRT